MASSNLQRRVLVINASFEAVNVVTAQRAMTLIFKGAAIVQEASEHFVRTSKLRFPLPSVIRLTSYRYVPRHSRSVSRKSILERDNHECQYCLVKLAASKLTLDHVVPRCRGGRSTWENLVAACYACNNKKSDRTPAEAGLKLAKMPKPYSLHAKHRAAAAADKSWDPYLFV